jgi:2-oxoglutarate dehydrogenase E1 component
VLTPKSLLREVKVMSPLTEFCEGRFQTVLADNRPGTAAPSRILISSGKVSVDLEKALSDEQRDDVASIRLEQLYPFPARRLRDILRTYPAKTPVYWVQEEPRNMGAWYFIKVKWDEFEMSSQWPLTGVHRPESASPATGSKKTHRLEQDELISAALGTAAAPALPIASGSS